MQLKMRRVMMKVASDKRSSFNDRLMLLVGVPVVLAWMSFACIVIWRGLNDDKILNNIDGFTTLIAIIGGPALLILTSMLELWKQEQAQEIGALPDEWASLRASHELLAEREHNLAQAQAIHARALEAERQKVDLGLEGAIDDEDE